MARTVEFEFSRSRGIVWVCDVAGSSSRLNSADGVDDTEAFLPRLYWTAALAVESAGGKFIKWTGDGFLAWFETPLHRDLERMARRCIEAVWHLTVMVNVTQLGLSPKRYFRVRHGLTYEQDALLTKIVHPGGSEALDLLGRAVVLAFRLSGVAAEFPGITTQKDIVRAVDSFPTLQFRKWIPTAEERLKVFKGEKWGTNALWISGLKRPRSRRETAAVKQMKKAVRKAEGLEPMDDARLAFSKSLYDGLMAGPEWSQKVAADYTRFIREEVYGSLKAYSNTVQKQR